MLQLNLPKATEKKNTDLYGDYLPARQSTRPGVPATNSAARTTISFHRHEVVIRKDGPLATALAFIEGSFLIASTVALISLSGASVAIAATVMSL